MVEKGISPKTQGHLYVCSLLEVSTEHGLVLPVPLSGTDWLNPTWLLSVYAGFSALADEKKLRKGRKAIS